MNTPHPTAEKLLEGISEGNRAALARGITLVESSKPADQEIAAHIVEGCLSGAGKSLRIGVTGVPGAGKSTLIEHLGLILVASGYRVAVLAVDPSSRISKGSILGDKTRMDKLSRSPNAFIRPSPAGETLGGVARTTRESILLCEAAGFDVLLIETVGVGQSETAVYDLVDFFLLLQLTGAGDELQGIKRGILEMADAILITKAEGNNLDSALKAKAMLELSLHYYPDKPGGWKPPVLLCSALEGTGLDALWEHILEFKAMGLKHGTLMENRRNQNLKWFRQSLDSGLRNFFYNNPKFKKTFDSLEQAVESGTISPFRAAGQLIRQLE